MQPVRSLYEDNCVVLEEDHVNIIAMYVRPPGGKSTLNLVKILTRCLQLKHNKGKTIVVGDFDFRLDKTEHRRTIQFEEAGGLKSSRA